MNDNISINDMLKNAAERAKKKAGLNSEAKKNYSNWDNYPKNDSKPFDFNKTTENLTKKVEQFSSTVSVKLAQSLSDLNDRVNQQKDGRPPKDSETDLADAYPDLKDDWDNTDFTLLNSGEGSLYDPLKYADVPEEETKPKTFFTSQKMEGLMDGLMKTSQKARESELYGKISKGLSEYTTNLSNALDESDEFAADTDGARLFNDVKKHNTPIVVSGDAKNRVVQELSDVAHSQKYELDQIPVILKDDLSLRRLISEVRENNNSQRVVILDISESPNAEQLRFFEKMVEEAKSGKFALIVLSDDEFSNSWFVINGALQQIFDY